MKINTHNIHTHLATLDGPPKKPRTLKELWEVFAAMQLKAMKERAAMGPGPGVVSEGWFTRQQEQFEATREGLVP